MNLPSKGIAGLVKVVVKGNFVGVVCEREEQAIRAARDLKVTWEGSQVLPPMSELYATLRKIPSNDREAAKTGDVEGALAGAAKTLNATYQWPFQLHASIGPSCGLAHVRDGEATIWSGTQGAHQLRPTIAQLLGISAADVRVVFVEASGCYGHNGSDRLSESPSAYSGCDTMSMAGSRWDQRWLWTFVAVLIRKEMWSRGTTKFGRRRTQAVPTAVPEVSWPAP
jgi:xanthine dehydrogenase molybdopterin-binding subunit B